MSGGWQAVAERDRRVEGTMWGFKTWVIIEKKGKIINNYNRNASPAGQTLKTEQNNTKLAYDDRTSYSRRPCHVECIFSILYYRTILITSRSPAKTTTIYYLLVLFLNGIEHSFQSPWSSVRRSQRYRRVYTMNLIKSKA